MDEDHNRNLYVYGGGLKSCAGIASGAFINGFMTNHSDSSPMEGIAWMHHILSIPPYICQNIFRMEAHVVHKLCSDLMSTYALQITNVSALEKVGIFLYVLGRSRTNRDARAIVGYSEDTISRFFHEVLDCMVGRTNDNNGLVKHMLQPIDLSFSVPQTLLNDQRYYPYFENCIGAIDGTHISAFVPKYMEGRFQNRKGFCSFNVLAACDFDLHFSFVTVGYEGSAHDSKFLNHVLKYNRNLFPIPPAGKYHLADKGFPDRIGFLTPYHDERYHLSEFWAQAPRSALELFNKRHSSLRSCIDRSFGCLKQKWKILNFMPSYSLDKQIDIITSCFALHNYVRLHKQEDTHFNYAHGYPQLLQPRRDVEHEDPIPTDEQAPADQRLIMSAVRDAIAATIVGTA